MASAVLQRGSFLAGDETTAAEPQERVSLNRGGLLLESLADLVFEAKGVSEPDVRPGIAALVPAIEIFVGL